MADVLTTLADLERRYNGPVPEPSREIARHGSAAAVALLAADGSLWFFRQMIRGQVRAIRARRADGSFYPAMIEDLACYRCGFRKALRQRQAVRVRIADMRKREAA